jgi:hypothetical protein
MFAAALVRGSRDRVLFRLAEWKALVFHSMREGISG